MRWDVAQRAILARLETDSELIGILGGPHIYRSGSRRNARVPSVAYTNIATVPTERYESMLVQFDVFARSYAEAVSIEARLRAQLARDLPEKVGDVWMFLEWVAARDHPDPDEGTVHRSIDFRFQPVRDP